MPSPRLKLAPHVSYEQLTQHYRTCRDGKERTRWHVLWLMSHPDTPFSSAEAAQVVGFSADWVRKLVRRYNVQGPPSVPDQHRVHPGGHQARLDAGQRTRLQAALQGRPVDGGLWTGPKVARWITQETGASTSAVTGWHYLRRLEFTLQQPRPRHPEAASEADQTLWKKNLRRRSTA